LHQGQFRRGKAPFPYVSHLFSVACIIADYTKDEDIVIAGLLHDTLEDTEYTAEELAADFGSRVQSIVLGVSERTDPKDPRPWFERKDAYIATLANASEESRIVAAADTIHNLRSVIEEYQGNFERYLLDFGGSLEQRLSLYERKSQVFNEGIENAIVEEFNHVFEEYKNFIRQESTLL
jgi:(p)ppGpp synthase/HD superfamily hydrolase